jgi:hypothetical protein
LFPTWRIEHVADLDGATAAGAGAATGGAAAAAVAILGVGLDRRDALDALGQRVRERQQNPTLPRRRVDVALEPGDGTTATSLQRTFNVHSTYIQRTFNVHSTYTAFPACWTIGFCRASSFRLPLVFRVTKIVAPYCSVILEVILEPWLGISIKAPLSSPSCTVARRFNPLLLFLLLIAAWPLTRQMSRSQYIVYRRKKMRILSVRKGAI